MRLARLLASGLLGSGALALILYAAGRVLLGLVAFTLRVWPFRLLHLVREHHGPPGAPRLPGAGCWRAIGVGSRTLDYVGLLQPALSLGETILATELGRGSISFSVGDIVAFVLTIGLAYLLSTFIRFVLQEDVYPHTRLPRGAFVRAVEPAELRRSSPSGSCWPWARSGWISPR